MTAVVPIDPADLGERIIVSIGPCRFGGRWQTAEAPVSVAWLASRLPIEGRLLQARWSGEAGWLPLGDMPKLAPEDATAYPSPGQVLLYAGAESEPELLVPYGACAFASKAGRLAGNPVILLDDGPADLRVIGELLLQQGAQPLRLVAA